MKNKIIIILFISLNTFSANAQKIRLGINSGMTLANFRGNEIADDLKTDISYLVGTTLEYYVSENLSLKMNVNFEKKRLTREDLFFFGNQSFEIRTSRIKYEYLTIPIMLKRDFGKSNNFFINGGAYISFLLAASLRADGISSFEIDNTVKDNDFGLTLGFGTTFKLKNNNSLLLEVRDNFGLTNISNTIVFFEDFTFKEGDLKTNAINLILTWNFAL
jgi:hypothetical protein